MSDENDDFPKGRSQERRGRWSRAELYRLKQLFGTCDDGVLARRLRRSEASVRRMAEVVFDPNRSAKRRGPKQEWAPEELERLRKCVGVSQLPRIAMILGRTPEDVRAKLEELANHPKRGDWSHDEVKALKTYYGWRHDHALVVILQRTVEEIRAAAAQHRLSKDKAFLRREAGESVRSASRMPRWTPEQEKQLVELYPNLSNLQLATQLGRSVKSIMSKANELKLKKSKELREAVGRRNVGVRYGRGSTMPNPLAAGTTAPKPTAIAAEGALPAAPPPGRSIGDGDTPDGN
ncbi:MAG: hypothetical protein JNJ88_12575 [Planctomycetes bacterium]|nr:hypothetical protein [Planctomycetota bacterium]